MEILGRPYVFGDPEQSEWIRQQYRKEDLQNQIVSGLQQALNSIDEYVNLFSPTKQLHSTVNHAVDKLKYIAGIIYHEDIEAESIVNNGLFIKWEGVNQKEGTHV